MNIRGFSYACSNINLERHCVFQLIFADSCLSCVCSLVKSVLLMSLQLGLADGALPCQALYFGNFFPLVIGPICTSYISILRLRAINQPNQPEPQGLACKVKISLLFYCGVFVAINGYHIHTGLPISFASEYCMHHEKAEPMGLESRLINLLLLIPPLVSLLSDYKVVRLIRRIANESAVVSETPSVTATKRPQGLANWQTVPVKATVISALLLVEYFCVAILINFTNFDVRTKALCLILCGLFVNSLRSPLTILTTFRFNQEQQRYQNREAIRAKNLDRELFLANKRRQAQEPSKERF
ncbi:uncharacterized protein LOC131883610 isoform X2 [Tigriopus californicus]|nr:uncharacterized protein LOC131883610 isoform X2 [Tigriopus californicus]